MTPLVLLIFGSLWLKTPLYFGLIDVVMISNLLVVVILGGYETFLSRLNLQNQPEWLNHVNASVLKTRLAMAIIGIFFIHLLHSFIEASSIDMPGAHITESAVLWQTILHTMLILSVIVIAWVDRTTQAKHS